MRAAKDQRDETRVGRTVRALAEKSAAAPEGAYLGAEEELLEELGVSRPTLRQAAKILQSERLIHIRAGQRGGYFAARPDARDVIRAPARYLRLAGATLPQIFAVTRPIAEEAAVEAARNTDFALRAELQAFRARIEDREGESAADIIQHETSLARLLARMSGNPAFELFIEIGYSFGLEEKNAHFYERQEDRAWAREIQRKLCDAVLSHDPDVTRLMMRRRSEKLATWFERENVQ